MAVLDAKDLTHQASTKAITTTKAEAKTLEGKAPLNVDGGTLPLETRVLLKDQAKAEQNGLYEVTKNEAFGGGGTFAGAGSFGVGSDWTLQRTSDADSAEELKAGMLVPIEDGEANQSTSWLQRTEGAIEVGTTALSFEALAAGARGNASGDLEGLYAAPTVAESVIGSRELEPEAVIANNLAASSKQLFPQLAKAGASKTGYGETTMTFAKKLVSNTVEVSHGLGVKPMAVNLQIESEGDEGIFSPRVWARTPTSFKFAYRCDGERNGSFTVLWEATG